MFNLYRVNKMKRSLIVAAALASLGASAFAQSNVTIYGRLNVTVERQKLVSGTNDWVMQNNASRWGLKGSEDLGGGMATGFQIESGFNPANGAVSSSFWGRQSELNLGGAFGKVRLGNFLSEAYEASADYVGMHNHETGTSQDAFYAYIGRNTSKVAYRTPSFSGATVEGSVTAAGSDPNRTFDLAFNYDAGPLHLGAGYEKNSPTDSAAKEFSVRALYEMGAFTFGGYVQRDTDGWGSGLGDRTSLRLAGMYVIGSTELHLNYGHAGDYNKTAADTSANQYTLEVNQNLSKRTKVYAFYTKIGGNGANFYGTRNFGLTESVAVGVRHNF
jgi:predicted porin